MGEETTLKPFKNDFHKLPGGDIHSERMNEESD